MSVTSENSVKMVMCPAGKCGIQVSKEELPRHLEACREWQRYQKSVHNRGMVKVDQLLKDRKLHPVSERRVYVTNTIRYCQRKREEKPYNLTDVMAITKYVLRHIDHFQAAREAGTISEEVKKLTSSKIYIAEMFT